MTAVPAPEASVVIPFYEDQRRLDLVLAALELDQELGGSFEVIIADDGSQVPPFPGPRPYPVRVVRHTDLGNRTGSARNAGASAARSPLLVFIDGDTVPAPGFLGAIAEACEGRHLTVGRRRHADLSTITPVQVRDWLAGLGPAPVVLPEPSWLSEGYAASNGLRESDLRSYRFIISALLACPTSLFHRVGGFAAELVGYGGEDWEFARRVWLAGAELRYAERAVGWHDGPDLAGRPEDVVQVKNAETLRIAELLTDPWLRGRGLWWRHPRIVVRCAPGATEDLAAWVACAEGLLEAGDIGVWMGDGPRWPVGDPRVHAGMPPAASLGRAELVIDLAAPIEVDVATLRAWERRGPSAGGDLLWAGSPRDMALGATASAVDPPPRIPRGVALEAWFASRAQK